MYFPIFSNIIFIFSLIFLSSYFFNFLSVYRTSFSHSFIVRLLAKSSLSFFFFWKCLHFPFLPKGYFYCVQELSWWFFLFSTWKILCLFLWPSVSDEKSTVTQIVSPINKMLFSFGWSQDFFPSIFSFYKFKYDVSWDGYP